jgi:hypothetical protein
MHTTSTDSIRWKLVTLSSALALSICLTFGYFDVATHFSLYLTVYYGAVFLLGAVAGLCRCGLCREVGEASLERRASFSGRYDSALAMDSFADWIARREAYDRFRGFTHS